MTGWKNSVLPVSVLFLLAVALSGCLATDAPPKLFCDENGLNCAFNLPANAMRSCSISCEWSGVGTMCPPGVITLPWMQIAFLGILIILLALSVIYMSAVVMKKIDWIIFVKEEFYQTIISAILILVVAWFAVGACEVSWALANQDPFTAADIYLNNLIWEKTVQYATSLALTSIYLQITAAFFLPMGQPPGGTRPMAGLDAVAGTYDFLFSIMATIFASLLMQVIMLKVIQGFMFKVVLPLGIFFRVFPFLRQAGATFIAIALGFYLVMPMMYVMDMKVVERASGSDITFKNDPSWQQSTFGNNPNIGTYVTELTRIDPFNNVNNVAKLIPQAVFLPALNTVVVYAFMKSFAKILTQRFPSPFE